MNTGCKVWLWFLLVVNSIWVLRVLYYLVTGYLLFSNVAFTLISSALLLTGVCLLLFAKKWIGLYLVCGAAAINFIINLLNGNNIVYSLAALIIGPAILLCVVNSCKEAFN